MIYACLNGADDGQLVEQRLQADAAAAAAHNVRDPHLCSTLFWSELFRA